MTFDALNEFTELWTRSIFELCQSRRVPFVLGRDTTFFEKDGASDFERHCELGVPHKDFETRAFATHHAFNAASFERREAFASSLGVLLAGPKPPTSLTFLDEWHYDRQGTRLMAEELATAIAPLLANA